VKFRSINKHRFLGQLHEFLTLGFFHKSTPPRALIHCLRPFRIWSRIRRENRNIRMSDGQWPRWNRFSGVNDQLVMTCKMVTAFSWPYGD
jgi:hypothetical protein